MFVHGAGAVSTLGSGVAQISAAVRAGLGRFVRGPECDRSGLPLLTARVPPRELERLGLRPRESTSWWPRALAFAGEAIREALGGTTRDRMPVLVALPCDPDAPPAVGVLAELECRCGAPIDRASSRVFVGGASELFVALARARELLDAGAASVLVGAVDSSIDERRLAQLDLDRGVAKIGSGANLVPAEGAAFVLLSSQRSAVAIDAVGHDARATQSDAEPIARAEALALAIRAIDDGRAFATVWAGLDGDTRTSKTWGVALVRHSSALPRQARLEHPADCLGDAGTAMGALMLALAQHNLREGSREGPALVWAASDDGSCGCARLCKGGVR